MDLGDRMKRYESVSRPFLLTRTPVIIRVDGRAFHTYCKGLEKPFDNTFIDAMLVAATNTAMSLQGFKLGYVQSDEASFVITDYDRVESEGHFGYNLSKIISLTASKMTAEFNANSPYGNLATFDARAFNVPPDEIANYFLWRARDWNRNSLQMYCQSVFSHKQLHEKKQPDMHDMLHNKSLSWEDDLTPTQKNGTWITKDGYNQHETLPKFKDIDSLVTDMFLQEVLDAL